jgi:two-component system response regulator HydG
MQMARTMLASVVMHSRLLIVDDDRDMREALGSLFTGEGHACELAADAATALDLVDQRTFDAVVSDVRMEGMDGLDMLDRLRQSHPALPVVVITGAGGVHQAVEAIKRGAFGYMLKPCDPGELHRVVTGAIDARRRPSEPLLAVAAAPHPVDADLVGSSPAMRALQKNIDCVARSSAPVLVTGETGAGKELVARAIHARSPRAMHPFIAINTSAIPQELLEGELFGHIRGGFTGAIQSRKGLLTEADGGTLLLDEIGDMAFGLQAKLLRVLQFGDVRPVGSDRVHRVDVRIIASTHRSLPSLVKAGHFREDLYFRLNVLSVNVPPLRERREDIPALAAHFLADARLRAPASPVRTIGPRALRALTEQGWPGNVRELANSIERAVVLGVDAMIDEAQLAPASSATPASGWPFQGDPPWTLLRLSRTYAEWVLVQTGGNKQRAAEILGIDLSTLYRWQRGHVD